MHPRSRTTGSGCRRSWGKNSDDGAASTTGLGSISDVRNNDVGYSTVSRELTRMTAEALAGFISRGEVSAEEVTRAHLDRIEAVDGAVHAFLHVSTESALAQARAVDAARAAGATPASPLAGVPLALKDIVVQAGIPATAGSKILEGWIPPYDATVTTRLLDAGIVILGKTNLDEFAMGSSTENSAYGPTRNPWDLSKIPGGSGGGSAAALAAFEAPLAIGTDTGGSIRQPAAVTGTVGAKPTYGGVSRYGVIALASSLDQVGPCARTVTDTALLHEVIAGHDPRDSTSIPQPVPRVVDAVRRGQLDGVAGMRIGVVKQLRGEGYQAGVLESFDAAVATLQCRRGRDRRGRLPALPIRAGRVLPDPAQRVLLQPGPVRRDAVRAAGRRRRQPVRGGGDVADQWARASAPR